ncbi:hypothetical protein FRB95_014291 [Tulasnella sp. JGI-2019a]|nr:hypothetical protein FRB95_014291 [Tulasnella sp. JGI-2019a]
MAVSTGPMIQMTCRIVLKTSKMKIPIRLGTRKTTISRERDSQSMSLDPTYLLPSTPNSE